MLKRWVQSGLESPFLLTSGGDGSSNLTGKKKPNNSEQMNPGGDALPLQVLRSGCSVKPTGQLQRTPVTES